MEMEKQKRSEENVSQPRKQSRVKKIAKGFIPQVIATDAIKEGAGVVGDLWRQLANRRKHLAERETGDPADFQALCEENELGEKELVERKAIVLRSKRLSWMFMVCMLVWTLLGITAIIIQGVDWFSLSITILSIPLALLFFAWNFRYTLHLWQLERRKLGGVHDFFQDRGMMRLFRY